MATDLAEQIAEGRLDGVEDAWLARLAEAPGDLDFFAGTARALQSADEGEQAGFLLQMLDEHLQQAGMWAERLELLRRAGDLLAGEPLALHAEILRTLAARHAESELYPKLEEKVGLRRAPEETARTWEKVARLEELMALVPGTVVEMEGKGAGRVVEINLQLDSFRVELQGLGVLSVGFAAAKKLLRPLSPDHVLRRRLEDPEGLVALKEEQPDELVRVVLASYPEPLTGNDIRQALAGIVGEGEWTAFWNRARKSPQLVALPGGKQRYRWAESAGAAVAGVRERFAAAEWRQRIDLLRSHGDRDPELRREMVATLARDAGALAPTDPAAALEIALSLERQGESLSGTGASPEALLAAGDDPARLILALGDRALREEAYKRLATARADWVSVSEKALLREEDPRALDLLADRLAATAPARLDRAVGELLTQPRKSPAGFTWLAERAARDEGLLRRSPFRLFQQVLASAGDSAFSSSKKRLLKQAESGGTLPRLLPHLDASQAAQAEELVAKASALEAYQRDALRNAIHLRFPELRQAEEQPLYATPEAIAAKKEELRALLEEEIPANRKAIEEARELGDLRENFEYKSARQRHEYLAARAAALHRDLGRARPVDAAKVDPSAVRVGTRVRLVGPDGEERRFTVLGPWDSQPEQGVLSNESDLAASMLGKQPGDTLQLEGRSFRVTEILPYR